MRIQNNKVADLRRDYTSNILSKDEVLDSPIAQFEKWLNEAIEGKALEPNAMTLATVGKDGWPSARIVLLKGIDENGFLFYTNYQSKKAQQMAENPKAALVFCWLEMERQVRIEGEIELAEPSTSDNYYQSRPKGSRIGAWVSPQSESINSRELLDKRVGEMNTLFEGEENIPRPPFWGGYRLKPRKIEFWQGRSSRLHDRIAYHHHQGEWKIERLAP